MTGTKSGGGAGIEFVTTGVVGLRCNGGCGGPAKRLVLTDGIFKGTACCDDERCGARSIAWDRINPIPDEQGMSLDDVLSMEDGSR